MNLVLISLSAFDRCSSAMSFGLDDSVDEWLDERLECQEYERVLERREYGSSLQYLRDERFDEIWVSMSESTSDAFGERGQRC